MKNKEINMKKSWKDDNILLKESGNPKTMYGGKLIKYKEFKEESWTPKTLYEFAKEHGFEDATFVYHNNMTAEFVAKSVYYSEKETSRDAQYYGGAPEIEKTIRLG